MFGSHRKMESMNGADLELGLVLIGGSGAYFSCACVVGLGEGKGKVLKFKWCGWLGK